MNLFLESKNASAILRTATTKQKNDALKAVSLAIKENIDEILHANLLDVEEQKEKGVVNSLIDRLLLTRERLLSICSDVLSVAALPDYVGLTLDKWTTPNGLNIEKVSVPFGVIGVIYEARPNVTVDVFSLCLKTSNACILKGGANARRTNEKIVEIIKNALDKTDIPSTAICLMPSTRESANSLINARGMVDLIVPRGSKGLINWVVENSLVPVIETGAGVCHTFVSKSAKLDQAFNIVKNAKMSRPSVCNAMETLLIHRDVAVEFVNLIKKELHDLILRGGAEEINILGVSPLTELGYDMEYGDYELSIKLCDDVKQAVCHVNQHGTHHSDCICTSDEQEAEYFLNNVDSACVYLNASTRFSDGGCFGFGAELGISTQKSHARGPMGLKEMTTYQYKIKGNGQIR